MRKPLGFTNGERNKPQMNTDRLFALLLRIKNDLSKSKLPQRVQELSTALQTHVNNNHPQYKEALGVALKAAYAAASASQLHLLSPLWRQMIEEIGYGDCMGPAVEQVIREAFTQAELTPTLVKEVIDSLNARLQSLNTAANDGTLVLASLSIKADDIAFDRSELAFAIPPAAVDWNLSKFADECREFDFIFGAFSELAVGERESFHIHRISSSDLSVYLDSAPAVAALVAAAAERILAVYKQLLEIRKLRTEMLAQKVPKEALKSVEDHANTRMSEAIEKIATELAGDYTELHEAGRLKELENGLRLALARLANRIDRGYHIEVRNSSRKPPRDRALPEGISKQVAIIERIAPKLEFVRQKGDPILCLPEIDDSGADVLEDQK